MHGTNYMLVCSIYMYDRSLKTDLYIIEISLFIIVDWKWWFILKLLSKKFQMINVQSDFFCVYLSWSQSISIHFAIQSFSTILTKKKYNASKNGFLFKFAWYKIQVLCARNDDSSFAYCKMFTYMWRHFVQWCSIPHTLM